ncbi:ParM/StbA family protein [Terrisporobacter petrolearius]|uniref:ParM/StbA family protein n=1 Tax=Terrisporobacter petrolearius TaxID=1460447 RepID=UPI0031CC4017
MKIVSIGLDLGNSMLKATKYDKSEKIRVKVPNRIQYSKTLNPKAKKIEFDGNTLYVGVGELNNNVIKHNRKHLLEQTLVMINELYPTEKELKVDLNLGLPPAQYFNESYLSEFIDLFTIGKEFCYSVNGENKKVTFNSVDVKVEGYSAFVSNVDSIGDTKQDILSIDVGGGTTDLCNYIYDYEDEMYYPDMTLTVTKGVIDFGEEIAIYFNEKENADIKKDLIDTYLKNNKTEIEYKDKKYKLDDYINAIKPTTDDILNKITNKFGSLDRYVVIGTGGGYKTFNKMIKDEIANEIKLDEDNQFYGNADGYLEH